ncbi:MAG TPA: YdcF family protein [Candidatus Cybelea sp.]|nr:YdcF family protein [Candidatus Cybelea sp.]
MGAARKAERGGIIFKFLALCCLIAFLFVLVLLRHPLLRVMGSALIRNDSPRASDAIVILGDDNYQADRAAKAADLLKAGWAPRVVASGRYLRPYASIAQLEQRDLRERGAPASSIVLFPQHARNTREECSALSPFVTSRGWKRILIVTSSYHTRRADYICSRLLPAGTELHVIAAEDSDYNPDDWWDSRWGTEIFFHEVYGLVLALWDLRHTSVQTVN